MEQKKAANKSSVIAAVLLFGFCLSIIPILYAGFFIHPIADDYSYSYRVHFAFLNGESILKAVIETVSSTYTYWQGAFSAVAIFSLQPGAFSPSYYFLTTFIMVGFLTGSTFFMFETIVKKVLNGKTSHTIILSCLTLIMSMQFVPDIHETFYWFNGSSYYTLFYSLALIFVALLLRLRIAESNKYKYVLFVACLFLGPIIGGGNYTTALVVAELIALLTIVEFGHRSNKRWLLLIILLLYIASFFINALAPGNSVRADTLTSSNPFLAIIKSLIHALVKIGVWTAMPQLIYMIAIAILSIFLVPKCSAKFKHPLLCIGLAFALFASQMTPPLYAMSNLGAGRQIDIYYFSYYLLIAFTVFYLCGWIYHRLIEQSGIRNSHVTFGISALVYRHLFIVSIILFILWGAACVGYFKYSIQDMTSVQTTLSILDGTLVKYDDEYKRIMNTLESESGDIEIEDIKSVPSYLTNLGLSEDTGYWRNEAVSIFFGVKSIKAPLTENNP